MGAVEGLRDQREVVSFRLPELSSTSSLVDLELLAKCAAVIGRFG